MRGARCCGNAENGGGNGGGGGVRGDEGGDGKGREHGVMNLQSGCVFE